MASFKEQYDRNFTLSFLSTILAGFLAGWGFYAAILNVTDQHILAGDELRGMERNKIQMQITIDSNQKLLQFVTDSNRQLSDSCEKLREKLATFTGPSSVSSNTHGVSNKATNNGSVGGDMITIGQENK